MDRAVGHDVVAAGMHHLGPFEPVAHAIAGRRDPPFAIQKDIAGRAEFVVLRSHHHANRCLRNVEGVQRALMGSNMRGADVQRVAALQWAREGTADTGAGIDRQAAEYRLAVDTAFDRKIAEHAVTGRSEFQGLAFRDQSCFVR